jgi:hypothetical protein
MLSMNSELYAGSTAPGIVKSTAPRAATGANRMTLYPRYATRMRKPSASSEMMTLIDGR